MTDRVPTEVDAQQRLLAEDELYERLLAEEEFSVAPRNTIRVLAAALVVLVLLFISLSYFVFQVLSPTGGPVADRPVDGITWIRSIYGYGPREDQQFFRPTDVAIAPDGTIWGTDPARARVLGFNPDGTFHALIHTGPPARNVAKRIWRPEGIAVDEQGDIYIADFGSSKVMVFTAENLFVREWDVPAPVEIAVRGGKVAVGSIYGVALFDTAGRQLDVWGSRGRGRDQIDIAHGIAIADDGTVYVSDSQNARIKAYRPDGTVRWVYASPRGDSKATSETLAVEAEGKAVFQIPSGMTIDGRGRIVVVDPFEFTLTVVDPKGPVPRFIAKYGKQGGADAEFTYPTGVAYDPARDYFVVADTTNDRLQIVTIPGSAGPGLQPVRRALTGPVWLCLVPLAALAGALALATWGRRRRDRPVDGSDDES
ncbi:MAG: NHL repeat-containing protein [Coriobacteriia bacterium]|nr:NHL repeat-containing protein [Coriobacteriia bacterium]